jgi:hypothetical protein
MFCPRCGLRQPSDHRFCVSCGTHLPRSLLGSRGPKVSRWFWSIPVVEDDNPQTALRVSRYLEERIVESPEGSVRIPGHHVRFSMWVEDRAVCALSLPDHEAEALGEFLLASVTDGNEVGDLTVSGR